MQQCTKILFRVYKKLNMFQATTAHHQEPKTTLALHVQQPSTYAKPDAASAFLGC